MTHEEGPLRCYPSRVGELVRVVVITRLTIKPLAAIVAPYNCFRFYRCAVNKDYSNESDTEVRRVNDRLCKW